MKINVYELIYDVIQNVDGAFETLLEMHEKNILFAVKNTINATGYHELYSDESEELMNIAREELGIAVYKYKDDGQSSFQTFALFCINMRLKKEIRSRRSASNQLFNNAIRLDETVKEGEALYLIDLVENKHREFEGEKILDISNRDEILEYLSKYLKPIEYMVADYYLSGFKQTKIAIQLQIPQKRVNYICKKIRDLVQKRNVSKSL